MSWLVILAYLILGLYSVALLYVTLYCLMQFNLLYHYARQGKRTREPVTVRAPIAAPMAFAGDIDEEREETVALPPMVTIQLPIYNERYVIERLIDSVAAFDYPLDRFEIHILDDSTDDTVDIVRRKVEEYRAKGLQIEQIRRSNRQGYKAGALRDGMVRAQGEYIAIFDADFLPRPDFLRRTLPYFQDEKVGVVQTRWEHINEDYSLITRLQALQLNVHFTVEQKGRMAGQYLLQFNGTAGVWRRQAIEEAGGWEADTLTEDLDLSIRAQLKGWQIRYLEEVGSPAELPAEMNSLKSQQFRWMKGGAETAKKMLPTLWRSELNWWKKVQGTFHLLASTVFVFVFLTGVFSVPLLFLLSELVEQGFNRDFFAYFMVGLLSIALVYFAGNVWAPIHRDQPFWRLLLKFVVLFPLFLALSMGLSLHNSVAVLQGYRGKKSPFVRTPKFNIQSIKDRLQRNSYLKKRLSWTTIMEGLMALYFSGATVYGILTENTIFVVYHALLSIGFGTIFYFTLRHLSLK